MRVCTSNVDQQQTAFKELFDHCRHSFLALLALQTKTSFANSVDPDKTAHYEPSHQDLFCVSFRFDFITETLIRDNGSCQFQRWRRPL